MGKASKWIRNFLTGKKEDKFKQIDAPSIEKKTAQKSIHTGSPKVKRKWSFGRIAGKVAVHKFSTSFDSSDSAKLQVQAIVETPAPKTLPTAFSEVSKDIENAAATKIQAVFRSYLARKALHALRGLVKIQALVRGHLVRRQTTATLRRMHALLTIQVRARIHRIQMAQEANFLGKQPEIPWGKTPQRENRDLKDASHTEMLEVLKSRSGPLDRPSRKSIGHDSETLYSKPLSSSKRGHQYNYKKTLITAPNSPENYPTKSLSTSLRRSWEPNYMIKTESSRAKARCESEPKQRPKLGMRHNNKPTEPTKEFITSLDGRRQYLSSNSTRFNHGNPDYWAINLYE